MYVPIMGKYDQVSKADVCPEIISLQWFTFFISDYVPPGNTLWYRADISIEARISILA